MRLNPSFQAPASVAEIADTIIPNSFSGKLTYVAKYTDNVQIIVGGGTAPGAYTINPDLPEAITIAMAAITNKATVWGTFDNGRVTSLLLYSV